MCRNITMLRGLEPPATAAEVDAAARQYVRKVSGMTTPRQEADPAVEAAVRAVAQATEQLLGALPSRRQPPPTLPPSRRGHPLPPRAARDDLGPFPSSEGGRKLG